MTIEEISEKRHEAMERYSHLGATNTANLKPEEKIGLDIEYAKAKAEWLKWSSMYEAKIKEMAAAQEG